LSLYIAVMYREVLELRFTIGAQDLSVYRVDVTGKLLIKLLQVCVVYCSWMKTTRRWDELLPCRNQQMWMSELSMW